MEGIMVRRLKKRNIVYISGGTVQVVSALVTHEGIQIEESMTMPLKGFAKYLRGSSHREFSLVVNFPDERLESFMVPVVPRRYREKVIASELSRRMAGADCHFIYSLREEKKIDGRPMVEVGVFTVDSERLRALADLFSACGKRLNGIYSDVHVIKTLVPKGPPALCIFEIGHEKKMLLVNRGELLFTRKVESGTGERQGSFARDIYLSINYCQQNLRINPTYTLFLGASHTIVSDLSKTTPVASALIPRGVCVSHGTWQEYAVPISGLCAVRADDISPPCLRRSRRLERVLGLGATSLACLSLAGLLLLGLAIGRASRASDTLTAEKSRLSGLTSLRETYEKTLSAYTPYSFFFEELKQGSKKPFTRFIRSLSAVGPEDIIIEKITASIDGQQLLVKISGSISAHSFRKTRAVFKDFITRVNGLDRAAIEDKELMINDGRFRITVRYG
jgi:hypothetical protein